MRRIYLLAFLFICFSIACSDSQTELPQPGPVTFKYLALGDSYTIGQSVDSTERFPSQLTQLLMDEGFENSELRYIARTGWSTDQLIGAIENSEIANDYDLVSLLIGVNNQFRNYPFTQYETEFPELLDHAISFAGGDASKVFVVSIPDYAFTGFGQLFNTDTISAQLDRYNAYAQSIAESRNIPFFNITPISREGLADTTLVASDNLHPSGIQYQRWTDLMFEEVKLLLEQ